MLAFKKVTCLNCDANFASNNKFYKHFRNKDCRFILKSGVASLKAGLGKPDFSIELKSSPFFILTSLEAWLKITIYDFVIKILVSKLIKFTAIKL